MAFLTAHPNDTSFSQPTLSVASLSNIDLSRSHEPDTTVPVDDDRPATAASCISHELESHVFAGFDGVHYSPQPSQRRCSAEPSSNERVKSGHTSGPQQLPSPSDNANQQPHKTLSFYPARIPEMLKLPPKLSKSAKPANQLPKSKAVAAAQKHDKNPSTNTTTKSWLGDPLEGQLSFSCFPSEVGGNDEPVCTGDGGNADDISNGDVERETDPANERSVQMNEPLGDISVHASSNSVTHPAPASPLDSGSGPATQKPSRRTKIRKSLAGLPPHLRAFAFFDLPRSSPAITLKDGSATAALDSLLESSTTAPVTAFTDHTFAETTGSATPGRNAGPAVTSEAPTLSHGANSSRHSFWNFQKKPQNAAKTRQQDQPNIESPNVLASESGSTGSSPPHSPNSQDSSDPEADEALQNVEGEAFGPQEADASSKYIGLPTTLLAELQIRKQQQMQRTRTPYGMPGLHATLLEMDAIAERERQARKSQKINLAWEEPQPDNGQDNADDNIPLAILYTANAMSTNNLTAAVAEASRPLGLMEKRALEDTEPLSARRQRLQGAGRRAQQRQIGPLLNGDFIDSGVGNVDDDQPLSHRQRQLWARQSSYGTPHATAEGLGQYTAGERSPGLGLHHILLNQTGAADEEETLGRRRQRLQAHRQVA